MAAWVWRHEPRMRRAVPSCARCPPQPTPLAPALAAPRAIYTLADRAGGFGRNSRKNIADLKIPWGRDEGGAGEGSTWIWVARFMNWTHFLQTDSLIDVVCLLMSLPYDLDARQKYEGCLLMERLTYWLSWKPYSLALTDEGRIVNVNE